MSQTPRLSEVISAAIEQHQEEVFTALPGVVVSYDSTKQRANVQPAVDRIFTTEEGNLGLEILPVITNVPVCFPGAGDYSITFPVNKGDSVLLVFTSCSLDRWLSEGGRVKAHDAIRNDLSDAIAIPGLRPFKKPVGSSGVSSNALVIKGDNIKLGDATADDPIVRKSDLVRFIEDHFNVHTHSGGTISGLTGVPGTGLVTPPVSSVFPCSPVVDSK